MKDIKLSSGNNNIGTILRAKTIRNDKIFTFETIDNKEDGMGLKLATHAEKIKNLMSTTTRETIYDIVSCIISNDSSRILCVVQMSDEHSIIIQYETDTFKPTFNYEIKGHYIKAKDII